MFTVLATPEDTEQSYWNRPPYLLVVKDKPDKDKIIKMILNDLKLRGEDKASWKFILEEEYIYDIEEIKQ